MSNSIIITITPEIKDDGFVGISATAARADYGVLTEVDYAAIETFAYSLLTGKGVSRISYVDTDGNEHEA